MEDLFQKGKKTTLVAGSSTFFFAIAKGVIGFLSGSVVLIGDAIHSAADGMSTILAWVGLKIAQKDPTEKFPYGFYKAENVTALLISFLIFFASWNIAKESYSKLFTQYQLEIPIWAVSVAILDGIVMFLVGTYEMRSGESINSQSLIADGKESRLHLLSSGIVIAGLVATLFEVPYLEGIAGMIIALFVLEAGYDAAKGALFALMDVSPDEEIKDKIKHVLEDVSGIRDFTNLKLRKSGPFVFGEVEAKVRKSLNVTRANEISESIEGKIKEETSKVDSFSVKFVPFETDQQKICIPLEENEELESEISDHFGRANNFILLETKQGDINDFEIIENSYQDKEKRAGLAASKMLIKKKIDVLITKEIGPISLHTLRDNIVDVYQTDQKNIKEIVSSFSDKELTKLEEATKEKI